MTAIEVVGVAAGGLLALVGVSSAVRSLREPIPAETGGTRFLVAVHDAAKAGFWLALGAAFAGLSVVEDPFAYRWFALVPIGMAGLRLAAAALLSRG